MHRFRFLLLLNCVFALASSGQTLSFLAPVSAFVGGSARGTASLCETCLVTADFNRDGKPDIAYATTNGNGFPVAGVVLGNGDGTFRPGASFPVNQAAGTLFVGDFNGDGKIDLAISGNAVWLYLGDGTGGFAAPMLVSNCPSISVVLAADSDAAQDLICGASVLLSNGDGTFRDTLPHLSGQVLLGADFNQDGKQDLRLTNGTGQLAVMLGHGDGTFGPTMPILSS
jgi:hypothetical protein